MAALSNYAASKLNDHSNGVASYTEPTIYVALFTVTPTASTAGTEANYTGYARVALSGLMGTSTNGSASNTSNITFGLCTAGTNTITGFAFMDASTGGNVIKFGSCSLSVSTGITPQFATGNLTSTMS